MSYGTLKQASGKPASSGKQATTAFSSVRISVHLASKNLPCAAAAAVAGWAVAG